MNRSLAAGAVASLAVMGWLATSADAQRGARPADVARVAVAGPVSVSPRSAPPGSPISVAGAGCSGSGARVVVDFGTHVEGDFTSVDGPSRFIPDADGRWSGTVVLPDGLVPGPNYAVQARCAGGTGHPTRYERASFEVELPRAPRPAAPVLAPPGFTG